MKIFSKEWRELLNSMDKMTKCPHCGTQIDLDHGITTMPSGRYAELKGCDCKRQKTWRQMPDGWYPKKDKNYD